MGNTATAPAKMSQAQIDALIAENAALKAKAAKATAISLKVGDKGGVSVCGLQRFPVTLYRQQWERLFAEVPKIQAFIAANASVLTVKE